MALRIAMLGHKRIPSREGGVEIVVAELSTRMAALGHSVTCYNRKGHHVSGKEYDDELLTDYCGVTLKRVFTIKRRGLAAMSSSFFAAIRAAFGRYDVVHFHAEGPCAMLWLPKLFGKKCIATIHGLDHQRDKWGKFASWYLMRGEKCAAKRADEIIVLSRNVADYFMEKYGRETTYIPNGVTVSQPVEADVITKEFGLHKDEYILFLGRLVPEKGVKYIIEAFKSLRVDKKLVIAGGSSDTAGFEGELKELAFGDPRIVFTGFVQGKVLEELYSNAYLYVLPSDLEGMPLSLLEAMGYGNCVLTSDIPECAEVVGDNGFTFPRADVNSLAESLKALCHDTNKVKEYGMRAREHVLNNYGWETAVQQTLKLYGVDTNGSVSSPEIEKSHENITG